jgi:hypothetical protein
MAHYAYLENNMVIAVIVGKDETELIDGLDTETYYALNTPYTVKRTSYNSNIRGNYAGVGYSYLPVEDIFMPPKCHNEALLDSVNAKWDCDNEEHNIESLA